MGREIGIPDKEGGGDRWSLDHLFLDQDGIPTVVEVKRSTDTRIRRAVVGQMLDYAANGIQYWPIESLRSRWESDHDHPQDAISELTDDALTYEGFWDQVENNLRARKVRLVWVADEVPTELQTTIEYLNEELKNGEALAVEVRQYVGDGLQILVPRVLGLSATQRVEKKHNTPGFEENLHRASDHVRAIADHFWELAERTEYLTSPTRTGLKVSCAEGGTAMLLYPQWEQVEFSIGQMADAGLEEETHRILNLLEAIAGRELSERNPVVPTERLGASWEHFVEDVLPLYREARLTVSEGRTI